MYDNTLKEMPCFRTHIKLVGDESQSQPLLSPFGDVVIPGNHPVVESQLTTDG